MIIYVFCPMTFTRVSCRYSYSNCYSYFYHTPAIIPATGCGIYIMHTVEISVLLGSRTPLLSSAVILNITSIRVILYLKFQAYSNVSIPLVLPTSSQGIISLSAILLRFLHSVSRISDLRNVGSESLVAMSV